MGDLDGDGRLDLYLCHFATISILRDGATISVRTVNGRPTVTGRYANRMRIVNGMMYELGESDAVFKNHGHGRFEKIPWSQMFRDESGNPSPSLPDFGLAVQIRDINNDGKPDIYVCNDFQTPDRLWLNQGAGIFKPAPSLNLRNMSYASMGVDFADINRDGFDDFITVEMLSRDPRHHLRQSSARIPLQRLPGQYIEREETTRNNLFLNRGDGTYADIALMAGVAATDWSWAPVFLDVDLDGFEDLLVSNGHLHDVNDRDIAENTPRQAGQVMSATKSVLDRYPALNPPKFAFRNRTDGTFELMPSWRFDSTTLAHGMCLADLDNDGDQDVILNSLNAPPLIYRNDSEAPRLAIRLNGRPHNTHGIGAKITVTGGPVVQSQEMLSGGRYLSSDDPIRTFAAGSLTNHLTVTVHWPNGTLQTLYNCEPNYLYRINEPTTPKLVDVKDSKPTPLATPPTTTWFTDATSELQHRHFEEGFDDFSLQPLLPWKQSQTGPGVAFAPINDGSDEVLVLGTGRGGRLSLLSSKQSTSPIPLEPAAPVLGPAEDDLTGLAAWRTEGQTLLLAAQARYENTGSPGAIHSLTIQSDKQTFEVQHIDLGTNGTGQLAITDFDGAGRLIVFAAGGPIPQRYPQHSPNRIYKLNKTTLELDAKLTESLNSTGLVRGGVWSDVDNDGLPDLLLVEEWGSPHLFLNRSGGLIDATKDWRLDDYKGLWSGVAVGDFNGDGRQDFIAGNWGLNTSYHAWETDQHELIYGDLVGIESLQTIEVARFKGLPALSPWRSLDILAKGFPGIRDSIKSHQAFSEIDMIAFLQPWKDRIHRLPINTFASMVFLNQGNRFEAHPLPSDAQQAPVFGISIADANGDGAEDVFLAQNFFAVRPEDTRMDAGRGLWLRGTGDGHFTPVPAQVSGVTAYSEQRGCAVADFDRDGRIDLVLAQNGAETKYFRNQSAKPGIRVRLEGPAHNRSGFGAVARIITNGKPGPAREWHAGSGWLSQDSAIQVLAKPNAASTIVVRWPGGKTTTNSIPQNFNEIALTAPQ